MDVILSDDTILQPDLLYVSKPRRQIIKQRVEGPPDLVIEIISGTSRRDRVEKLDLYADTTWANIGLSIRRRSCIEFLVNEGGRFVVQSPADDRYQSPRLPEIEIQRRRVLARSGRQDGLKRASSCCRCSALSTSLLSRSDECEQKSALTRLDGLPYLPAPRRGIERGARGASRRGRIQNTMRPAIWRHSRLARSSGRSGDQRTTWKGLPPG